MITADSSNIFRKDGFYNFLIEEEFLRVSNFVKALEKMRIQGKYNKNLRKIVCFLRKIIKKIEYSQKIRRKAFSKCIGTLMNNTILISLECIFSENI